MEFGALAVFVIYFAVILGFGFYFYRKSRGVDDFFLGGREINPYVTAISTQAADMSSWLLMGLPGAVLLCGLGEIWLGIGLVIGSYASWLFVAKRLRKHSVVAGNAITIPEFFSNRYRDEKGYLSMLCAAIILFFFIIYVASGFKGCAAILQTVFPELDISIAMTIGAVIVIVYTFMGGYKAICWNDMLQGMLMFVAIVVVPLAAIGYLGGWEEVTVAWESVGVENFTDVMWADGQQLTILGIFSSMAWALGYFGMPHLLVKFMGIRKAEDVKVARRVSLIWYIISLGAAIMIGMIGRAYLEIQYGGIPEGYDPEHILLTMIGNMFIPVIAGVLYAGVMAAIMSTADSQLLVASSSITNDVLKKLKKNITGHGLLLISRIVVISVATISLFLGLYGSSNIMELVSYAWAGFGAAFGPLMILSLYWKRMNLYGAYASVLSGSLTVIFWAILVPGTDVYELLPGFVVSLIAGIVVSLMTPAPPEEITEEFDKAQTFQE